jgi:hypothetical protein
VQLSFSFRNAELVAMGFQNLNAEIPQIGRLPIYRTAQEIIRRLKEYPSRVSTYIRTYVFRSGWSIDRYDLGYRISNRVPYGHYVVGNAFGAGQAWMHQGTWQTFRDVADEEADKLPEAVRDELTLAIRRNNLA